jgi:tetratricopeptide (TPR) repeat protein
MSAARARVLSDFPYPVAYPYALVFAADSPPSLRRWALCFTEYQLLRTVCLPLVGQYLREPINATAAEAIRSLNAAIAAIRSPFFYDWVTLVHTLRRHLPAAGITPLFPRLAGALDALKQAEARPVGLRGQTRLAPLEAILAVRNHTAHGGLADEDEAARHLETYLPVLHQVLDAFDFLGDADLLVCLDGPEAVAAGRARVRSLRGCRVNEPAEQDLPDHLAAAFAESEAVLVAADGRAAPLYPLLNPLPQREPLYLYDGHYGIRLEAKATVERGYLYYLGVHHRAEDTASCTRMKELLAGRRISFFLDKDKTAPWTIADSALDYSRRTLADLLGSKYFPECYVPFTELERHFAAFLRVPPPERWAATAARPWHVNGLLLVGLVGAGKTAFLARQVEALLRQPAAGDEAVVRENPNLVLFLRGNGVLPRPEGMSLFRDVAEKLGVAVGGKGFGSFRELLDHLHLQWRKDRVEGRRLILLFDALNEAPFAETVMREALELIGVAACYPWCKVVVSTRQEWLGIWSGKLQAQEAGPLEELRPWLYVPESERRPGLQGPPVVLMEPLTEEQAAAVYGRYQAEAGRPHDADGRVYRLSACRTPWPELPRLTRQLLLNPLYLHLFMEAFAGRDAGTVTAAPALFRQYVDRALQGRPHLERDIEAVLAHLLGDLERPSADLDDDDANSIRAVWAAGQWVEETRLLLSPVEALAHESWLRKRVREEGGGYRFVFQAVAEYLLYRHLLRSRPAEAEEVGYWTGRAGHERVFPEYAGAFGSLLRDWATAGKWRSLAEFVEASPGWLREVLTTFLLEQARLDHIPGRGSEAAQEMARRLAEHGNENCARALHSAGCQLSPTHLAPTASAYFRACANLRERLHRSDPDNGQVIDGLASALIGQGYLLRRAGQIAEAEQAFRRSLEIYETLHRANPDNVRVASGLGNALINLGHLLWAAGQVAEAEHALRRSVAINEALHRANPDNVEVAVSLGTALNNLGLLLKAAGRGAEAEQAYRRSVEIREALHRANPDNIEVARGLARTLINLGDLQVVHEIFSALPVPAGQVAEAEQAFRRSVAISEALHRVSPENVEVARVLGTALNNLGLLLKNARRWEEAWLAYRRSVEVNEVLHRDNPDNVEVAGELGSALINLGDLLRAAGLEAEAEQACRRSVEIYGPIHQANPDNLATALNNLGLLLKNAGRTAEAEQAYRRSVEIREALYRADPDNVEVLDRLDTALHNLSNLLWATGQAEEAREVSLRANDVRARRDLFIKADLALSLLKTVNPRAAEALGNWRTQPLGARPAHTETVPWVWLAVVVLPVVLLGALSTILALWSLFQGTSPH